MAPTATPGASVGTPLELRLLGGFSLEVAGTAVALPMHSRRVLAYLSLDHAQGYRCDRGVLAERLWPDAGTDRSRASLRTALWRIRRVDAQLVLVAPDSVRLGEGVRVDVHRFRRLADRMIDGRGVDGGEGTGEDAGDAGDAARVVARSTELLPGWDESWLVLAREQLRQARLHALEARAARLRRARRYPEAIEAMLDVIAEEPLRESAHAALIDVYLSEGNASEAVRQFDTFAALLWEELGIRPSRALGARLGLDLSTPARPPARPPVSLRPRPRVAVRAESRPS